jgi:hypothetical protein
LPPEENNPLIKLLMDVSSSQESLLEDHLLLFVREVVVSGTPSSSLPPGWEAVNPNYVAAQSASLAEQSESDGPSSIALLNKLCGSLSDLQHSIVPLPPEENNPLIKLLMDVSSSQESLLEDHLLLFVREVVVSGTQISSTNKTDRHNIAELLLKVALNTIILTLTTHILTHIFQLQ